MSVKNTPENFWARVAVSDKDSCWNWKGAVTSGGYGNLAWKGATTQAHRVAYMLTNGGIELTTGFRKAGAAKSYKQFVLHKCDNRLCCNPEHLFLGSMRDNQLDAYSKGRRVQPRSSHKNAKLTPVQVADIRKLYAAGGVKQSQLAAEFGVSQITVSLVVRRKTYKDVKE